MRIDLNARQEVRDIPRADLSAHHDGPGALPIGTPIRHRVRPITPGTTFTDTEVTLDYLAHTRPDTVHPEQLHSAIVYAARNATERIPERWMIRLMEDARADLCDTLDLYDVDCHSCKRAVLMRKPSDPCPGCGVTDPHADPLDTALALLRASGMVRH